MRQLFLIIVFIIYHFSDLCFGQNFQISATGHISAEVVPVFSASETSQMSFGRFSPGYEGGEIILTPENAVTVLGSVFVAVGLQNAASFYISGDDNASFTITLPADPVILKHSSNSKTMTVENWLSNIGSGIGAGILNNGEKIIYIGATLKVGTPQDNPVGTYAGTYNVTFDFN